MTRIVDAELYAAIRQELLGQADDLLRSISAAISTGPFFLRRAAASGLTQTDWRQIGETAMLHSKSGQIVEIKDETNLRYAIHAVIEIEYGFASLKLMTAWESADMLRKAHCAADNYLVSKTDADKSAV